VLCEQLQLLRAQTGLVDLDIVCEGHYIKVHKVVLAACSKFFKEQLCKYNVGAQVILRLEDFGLELKRDAVNYIIEFIYSGEVNIPGEKLTDLCQAAHTLGVLGLEHLPVPAARHGPTYHHKEHIQIADESELCGETTGLYHPMAGAQNTVENNSKMPMEVNPFLNSFHQHPVAAPSNDEIILLHTIDREEQNRNEASAPDHQDIIPISFSESALNGDCVGSDQYRNIQDILPRSLPEMLQEQSQSSTFLPNEEWPSFFQPHGHHPTVHHQFQQNHPDLRIGTKQIRNVVPSTAVVSSTETLHHHQISQTNTLQALFEAATDISQSTGVKPAATEVAGNPDSPVPQSVSQTAAIAPPVTVTADTSGGKQIKQVDTKQFNTTAPPLEPADKVNPSPGKSLSQGKLRVINQGLPQSENIQTPSSSGGLPGANRTGMAEKSRRRSGQVAHHHTHHLHQGTGHLPTQVSQVALSAQVSHVNHAHAAPATAAANQTNVRSSAVRVLSGAGDPDPGPPLVTAETDTDSQSEDEPELANNPGGGLTTPLGNWSEDNWSSTNRASCNNWTHPVESVGDTAPPSGAVWQLPNTTPTPSKLPVSSAAGQQWNLPGVASAQSVDELDERGPPVIPSWNTPVTNTNVINWNRSSGAAGAAAPPAPPLESSGSSRDTPPVVSWTQPQTSSSPTHANKDPAALAEPNGEERNGSGSTDTTLDTSQDSSQGGWVGPDAGEEGSSSSWSSTSNLPDDMLAIRSGIPLALQNKAIRSGVPIGPFQTKRKRKLRGASQDAASSSGGGSGSGKARKRASLSGTGVAGTKKGDLEVRKDLTIESATKVEVKHRQKLEDGGDGISAFVIDTALDTGDTEDDPGGGVERDPLSPFNSGTGGVQIKTVKELNSEFACEQCEATFYTEIQLKQHTQCIHAEQMYQVDQKVDQKEALQVHLYSNHGMGEVFRCEECPFETTNKAGYIKHISDHIPQDKEEKRCIKCEKVFKTKYGLTLHLKEHFDEKLSCIVCEFTTTQKSNLTKHMATKHGQDVDGRLLEDRFKCDTCEFRCVTKHILKNHILRKHTERDAMRFKCDECSYASVEKAALDKHRRFKHTNERPFMCAVCGFSTATASSMARHRRSHSQTKPYKCDICGHEYADKKRLRDHMYLHSDYKPFQCTMCNYTCRRSDNLSAHIKKHHENPKEESEVKAVIPDSTSETSESQTPPKVYEDSSRLTVAASVFSSTISTIQMSDIAVRDSPSNL